MCHNLKRGEVWTKIQFALYSRLSDKISMHEWAGFNKNVGHVKAFIASDKRGSQVNILLFLHKKMCSGYSLEESHQLASDEFPQHIFMKK